MKRKRIKFRNGERVRLVSFEDVPEQYGVVLGHKAGLYTVRVEPQYRERDDRDGLVEVDAGQLRKVSRL